MNALSATISRHQPILNIMDRRHFFQRVLQAEPAPALTLSSGLEPYKPTENLSYDDALHLLGRTTFGVSRADLTRAMTMKPADAVEALFSGNANPTPPSWTSINPDTENFTDPQARQSEYYRRYADLQVWWISQMRGASFSILEKLTLFWHSMLCSDYIKVYYPQYMYVQNSLFRKNAWGNVKTLIRALVADPAMLLYLDNLYSVKGNPNENFARELMELFSLGVNNYTEHDIVEAARALTGWRIKGLAGEFRQELWDASSKTFFGQSGNFNADDIVNIIFQQEAAAKYYARRVYKYFVYDTPDEAIVEQLATILKQNNFDLKPMLKTLLSSAHFFDAELRGSIVKTPVDFIVGLSRHINISALPDAYAVSVATSLNQEILYPPTVEGWKGAHSWLNTNLYPLRNRITEAAVEGRRQDNSANFSAKADVIAFAKQFSSVGVAADFVKDVARYLLPVTPGPKELTLLEEALLQGAKDYEWNIDMPNVDFRLRELLKAIMTLPEYQLQ